MILILLSGCSVCMRLWSVVQYRAMRRCDGGVPGNNGNDFSITYAPSTPSLGSTPAASTIIHDLVFTTIFYVTGSGRRFVHDELLSNVHS
jgi:hypothetical protein